MLAASHLLPGTHSQAPNKDLDKIFNTKGLILALLEALRRRQQRMLNGLGAARPMTLCSSLSNRASLIDVQLSGKIPGKIQALLQGRSITVDASLAIR